MHFHACVSLWLQSGKEKGGFVDQAGHENLNFGNQNKETNLVTPSFYEYLGMFISCSHFGVFCEGEK